MSYYELTPNYPQDGVQSSVAQEQAEYQKIKEGFDKVADYENNASKVVIINADGTKQTVLPRGTEGQVLTEREGNPPHWANLDNLPEFVELDNTNAAVDWAATHNTIAELTLNGNKTLNNPTAASDGQIIGLFVIQDATGSRTVTWGSEFSWGQLGVPALSTGANKRDFFSFVRRGTQWYNVGRSQDH